MKEERSGKVRSEGEMRKEEEDENIKRKKKMDMLNDKWIW